MVTSGILIKNVCNTQILNHFSPESYEILFPAGLLTYPASTAFPITTGQWLSVEPNNGTYSYGDSSGFTPDSLLIC
jgi:hypothetical protein